MHKKIFALLPVVMAVMANLSPATAQAARIYNQQVVEGDLPYNGFIVRYKDGTSERLDAVAARSAVVRSTGRLVASRAVDTSVKANAKTPFAMDIVRKLTNESHFVKPSRKLNRTEGLAAMRELAADPNVEYVEPNVIMRHQLVPNDPSYGQQWGYGSAGVRAEAAWDLATGAGVTVAVLDTGITSHPDLDAGIVPGSDFVTSTATSNDGDGRDENASDPGDACGADSASWHGTHVTGTIAARTNNGVGVSGLAFNAKVMPVRVLGVCGGDMTDIEAAITWSSGGHVDGKADLPANQVPKVINMSLGGQGECSPTLSAAINGSVSRGTTVVVAAGNSAKDATSFNPANCPGVIAVAAVDVNNNKAWFSNFGPKVDVAAPGVDILSTFNAGLTSPGAPNYHSYNGTSMASPHVAGVVALVQSRRLALSLPLLTPEQMRNLLKVAARPLAGTCFEGCGAGMVDAAGAVTMASLASVPIASQSDASGKVRVVLFERKAAAASSQFNNFAVDVPADYVVIGGGVQGAAAPTAQLMTASYPNATRSAWLVSTKDHQIAAPTTITGWALGLKIEGMTRAQLLSNLNYRMVSSTLTAQPSATSVVPAGYVQIGGGFQVVTSGTGNLAWASYPVSTPGGLAWTAAAKEHGSSSQATIRSYSIGLRTSLPVGVVSVSNVASAPSALAAQPAASASVNSGFALTGCGAMVNWSGGAGNLLWQVQPLMSASTATCDARSTEHIYGSPASITTHAVGIRLSN
jgi:serine protease